MDVTKAGHCCHATIKKSPKKSCTPRKTRLESSMAGYSYLKSNTWNTLVCDVTSCNLNANFTLRRRSFLGQMSWATQPRFRYTPYRSQRLYSAGIHIPRHDDDDYCSTKKLPFKFSSMQPRCQNRPRIQSSGIWTSNQMTRALWFILWLRSLSVKEEYFQYLYLLDTVEILVCCNKKSEEIKILRASVPIRCCASKFKAWNWKYSPQSPRRRPPAGFEWPMGPRQPLPPHVWLTEEWSDQQPTAGWTDRTHARCWHVDRRSQQLSRVRLICSLKGYQAVKQYDILNVSH